MNPASRSQQLGWTMMIVLREITKKIITLELEFVGVSSVDASKIID